MLLGILLEESAFLSLSITSKSLDLPIKFSFSFSFCSISSLTLSKSSIVSSSSSPCSLIIRAKSPFLLIPGIPAEVGTLVVILPFPLIFWPRILFVESVISSASLLALIGATAGTLSGIIGSLTGIALVSWILFSLEATFLFKLELTESSSKVLFAKVLAILSFVILFSIRLLIFSRGVILP